MGGNPLCLVWGRVAIAGPSAAVASSLAISNLKLGHLMDRTVHCCSRGMPSCQELLCLSSQAHDSGKMVLVAIDALGVPGCTSTW